MEKTYKGEPLKTYSIQKDVPIPRKGPWKYDFPWEDMDVGDSFVLTLTERDKRSGRVRKQSILTHAAKSLDMKIKTMRIDNTLRVWRVE